MSQPLTVALPSHSYPIHIAANLLADAGTHIAAVTPAKRLFIVTDETVAPLYLAKLEESLAKSGFTADSLILPPGETTKSFTQLQTVLDFLLTAKAERTTPLIALGGGVIGDLTGFAAAIFRRGMPFIQIPTTLLSQVDSAVGGKTGINVPEGKNLIGAFHQPLCVLSDLTSLTTLEERQLKAGYAEVVKYGLIDDPAFFAWLEENGDALLENTENALPFREKAVRTSCAAKARIVAEDEKETTGKRALLNLGHSFGHAFEAAAGYGTLLHGEAVALGMVMAFDLSVRLGLCPREDADRVKAHLSVSGLPVSLKEAGLPDDPARYADLMSHDKKVQDGRLTFILARGIGKAFTSADVPVDILHETLSACAK